jgi:transitional endoplasmic reticulum ATPase
LHFIIICVSQANPETGIKDLSKAILEKKATPNTFLVDDALAEAHSTIAVSPAKMEELSLFPGDTVVLKGKKRKETIAIVNPDESISDNKIRISKVMRSNIRFVNLT